MSHHEDDAGPMEKQQRQAAPGPRALCRLRDTDESTMSHRALAHMTEDIRSSMFAELQLVFLTFCTGMQGG